MIKHNRSFLELVTAIWCFGKALPLFNVLVLLRHKFFRPVWWNLRAQQGHRGRARASATISM
jgi:uncharacterized membrane protein YbaN (DUF454 family)